MKVLQIIGVLNRGGAETLLINILSNINREKYKFDFLVFEDKEYPYSEKVRSLGANIICIESPNKIGMIRFIKKLKKICQENEYDVIHAHTLFNCGPCLLAGFLAGIRVRIAHSHSTQKLDRVSSVKKNIYFFIAKILLNVFSTHKIACGDAAGKFLYFNKKYTILKNGIDIKNFNFNINTREVIREKYNISKNTLLLGHVGRLIYIKNQMFLLKIINKIIDTDVKLILVGDGEMKDEIEAYIKKQKLEDRVIMIGSTENVNDYYNAFDIFVFPSLFEGVPYTLIEAQANGLNILASNNISKECDITHSINFMKIGDEYIKNWIEEILKYKNNNKGRNNNAELIRKSGYSMEETVAFIEKIYNKEG